MYFLLNLRSCILFQFPLLLFLLTTSQYVNCDPVESNLKSTFPKSDNVSSTTSQQQQSTTIVTESSMHFNQFDFSNHFCWYNMTSEHETIVTMFRLFHYLIIQTTINRSIVDSDGSVIHYDDCKYFFYDLTKSVFLSSTIECDNIIGNETFTKIVSTESLDYEPAYDEEEDINDIELGGKHTIRIYGYDREMPGALVYRDYILWKIAKDNHTHHADEYESEEDIKQSEQTEYKQEAWAIPNIEYLPVAEKQYLTRTGISLLTILRINTRRMALITIDDHQDPLLMLANQTKFQDYFPYIGYVRAEWIIPNQNNSEQSFESKKREWISAYHFLYYNQYNIPNITELMADSPVNGINNSSNSNNDNRTIVYETIQLIDGPIHLLDNLDLIFTIPSNYFEEQFEACKCNMVQLDPYEDQTNGTALTDVKQHLKCDRQILLRSVFDRSLQTDVEIIRQGFWHSFFTIFLVLIMCFVVVCLCCIILTCLQTEMQGVLQNPNYESVGKQQSNDNKVNLNP